MRRDPFRDFVLEQLEGLSGVSSRAMFGGHGLYLEGAFFAILWKGRLYFRTDDDSRAEYVRRGMGPFRPSPRQTLGSYYEVPPELIEDRRLLAAWARRAAACPPAGRKRPRSRALRRAAGPRRR
jgi:DNA transformation protein